MPLPVIHSASIFQSIATWIPCYPLWNETRKYDLFAVSKANITHRGVALKCTRYCPIQWSLSDFEAAWLFFRLSRVHALVAGLVTSGGSAGNRKTTDARKQWPVSRFTREGLWQSLEINIFSNTALSYNDQYFESSECNSEQALRIVLMNWRHSVITLTATMGVPSIISITGNICLSLSIRLKQWWCDFVSWHAQNGHTSPDAVCYW